MDEFSTVKQLIAGLRSPQLARRMLATDQITDRLGRESIPSIREVFENSQGAEQELTRTHAMWILFRLGALTLDDVESAWQSESELLRSHVQRVLREWSEEAGVIPLVLQGLRDKSPLVNRTAAQASSRHRNVQVARELLALLERGAAHDVHLRHAARIALRDQLRDERAFHTLTTQIDPSRVGLIAGLCLSLKSPVAGQFLAQHIESLANDRDNLGKYVAMALEYAGGDSRAIVRVAREKFADDRDFQLQLLESVYSSRPLERMPKSVLEWAADLATELLHADATMTPIAWMELSSSQPTWVASNTRRSSDTRKQTLLWSSFPHGEQRMAVYRSDSFALPEQFDFFIAGHDGYPEKPIQHRNLVRLRDSRSTEVLKSWSPPRNDIAQPIRWSAGDLAGRDVYVELVDGDEASAFAWLAVGRFSVAGLNPTEILEDRRRAAELIADLRLKSLRPSASRLMLRAATDRQTRSYLARSIAAIDDDSIARAFATAASFSNVPLQLQAELAVAIESKELALSLLRLALRFSTSTEQQIIGKQLSADRQGVDTLLRLVDDGLVSAELLSRPEVAAGLSAVSNDEQKQWIEQLTAEMPVESEAVREAISARITQFEKNPGNVSRGKLVFEKNCANCHQVEGRGEQVGPNLDGIGNRGLLRIAEDILAPNRNVDVAFRATVIVTDAGKVISGLVQNETVDELTVVDSSGKGMVVSKAAIGTRKRISQSPMPANFADVLSTEQFSDLMSYLLTLNR